MKRLLFIYVYTSHNRHKKMTGDIFFPTKYETATAESKIINVKNIFLFHLCVKILPSKK